MARIPRRLKNNLLWLLSDFLISAVALVCTSKLRSKRKWKAIKRSSLNTGKYDTNAMVSNYK